MRAPLDTLDSTLDSGDLDTIEVANERLEAAKNRGRSEDSFWLVNGWKMQISLWRGVLTEPELRQSLKPAVDNAGSLNQQCSEKMVV